jgi:hypothetical protein
VESNVPSPSTDAVSTEPQREKPLDPPKEPQERFLWILEVLFFLGVGILALRGSWGRAIGGTFIDGIGTIWFHDWIAHCIRHGVDPTWTPWIFYPDGKDMVIATGMNFVDIVLAMPFYFALGTPRHFAPFVLFLMVGNALAMRLLLRTMGLSRLSVFVGSAFYAFTPFVLYEVDHGRFTQALLWFGPLALRELFLMDVDRRWRRPVLAGVYIALQALTYWYALYMFVLVVGPVLLLTGRTRDRGWWARLALAGGVAAILIAPVVIPIMIKMAAGVVPGTKHSRFVLEEAHRRSWVWGWSFVSPWQSDFQVPLFMLVVMALSLILCRRMLFWSIGAILGILFAAGPNFISIKVGKVANPLWTGAEALLPGFERLLWPYRFWAMAILMLAPALAEAIDFLGERFGRRVATPFALVALATLFVPLHAPFASIAVPRPAYVDAVRKNPGVVLDLPFPYADEEHHYQPMHGQPTIGGNAERMKEMRPKHILDRIEQDPVLSAVAQVGIGISQETLPDPHGLHIVRWIVVHKKIYPSGLFGEHWRGPPNCNRWRWVSNTLTRWLGPPHAEDDIAVAWDLKRLTDTSRTNVQP